MSYPITKLITIEDARQEKIINELLLADNKKSTISTEMVTAIEKELLPIWKQLIKLCKKEIPLKTNIDVSVSANIVLDEGKIKLDFYVDDDYLAEAAEDVLEALAKKHPTKVEVEKLWKQYLKIESKIETKYELADDLIFDYLENKYGSITC